MMSKRIQAFDVIIVGAGIAGAGIAAELGHSTRAVILEQEAGPGHHATGRSAAVFSESYGGPVVRALSRASRGFFERPPEGFTETRLLFPRGFLFIAREDQRAALENLADQPDMRSKSRRLTPEQALGHMPILQREYLSAALLESRASDIEVHALHQGYLKTFRRSGGQLFCNARVESIERQGSEWLVHTKAASFQAPLIVNAAGAWADLIANLAGVSGVGLQPMRRSAALVDAPGDISMDQWPLTIDIDETFYFKPDAGALLLSPCDETPSEPCDAQADEMDLAIAVDRIERATTLDIRRMRSRWAGLRSFVNDRSPVAGFSCDTSGFYWLVGQGGYGIQTAPALSRFAAADLLGRETPPDLRDWGIQAAALSPSRAGLHLP